MHSCSARHAAGLYRVVAAAHQHDGRTVREQRLRTGREYHRHRR